MSRITTMTLLILLVAAAAAAQVTVVNMVPQSRSGETNQDAETSIGVNPQSPNQIVGSAFTWDNLNMGAMVGANAPIYVSTDGGATWSLVLNVPSSMGGAFPTGDINFHFTN